MTEETRTCQICGQEKPLDGFDKSTDGKRGKCKFCRFAYRRNLRHRKPWYRTYYYIARRCRTDHKYGENGVKNHLKPKDLEKIWNRDNASSMDRPSIDRIDPTKDYTIDNVRYIELTENIKRSKMNTCRHKVI